MRNDISAGAVQPLTLRRSANAKEQATEAGTSGSGGLMQEGGMCDNPQDGEDFDIRAVSHRQRVQLNDSDDEQAVEAVTKTGTQIEVDELIRQKVRILVQSFSAVLAQSLCVSLYIEMRCAM